VFIGGYANAKHESNFDSQAGYKLNGIGSAAESIARALAADNSRFNREHFLAVVRGEKAITSRPAKAVQS